MLGRIRMRRDTSSNWSSYNPTLLVGEVGIETDTQKVKFGTGSEWISTEYFNILSNLKDLNLTDLANGCVLIYNSSTGKWDASAINVSGISSPAGSTRGDILVNDGTTWTRLAIGSDGYALVVSNGTLMYKDVTPTSVDGNLIPVNCKTSTSGTLKAGEMAFDTSRHLLKIGSNSSTPYNSAPYVKLQDDSVMGVAINTTSSNPSLERIDGYGDKITTSASTFNDSSLWGEIKRCLLSSDGTPTFGSNARGDGLTLTTSTNVMVRIPLAYTRSWVDGDYYCIAASASSFENSSVNHAFLQRGGTQKSSIYVGAYEGYSNSGKLGSSSGKTILRYKTMDEFEGMANLNGTGWGITNFWTRSLISMLFFIEYANLDCQAAIAPGNVNNSSPLITGADYTDSQISTNGTGTGQGTVGMTPVCYRGMENLWGNLSEMLIGFNSTTSAYRVAKRDGTSSLAGILSAYESSTTTPVSASDPTSQYIKTVCTDTIMLGSFVPSGTGGSTTTYYCDEFYPHNANNTNGIAIVGGAYAGGTSCGISSFAMNAPYTLSEDYACARLEFI